MRLAISLMSIILNKIILVYLYILLNTVIIIILNLTFIFQLSIQTRMSIEERNQFIPQNQNADPMFNHFMQNCFNNPSFFESMKNFYQTQTAPIPTNRSNSQNTSHNYMNSSITQSQPNLNQQSYAQNKRIQESRSQYNDKEKVVYQNSYDNFKNDLKNVGNPLLKYQEKQQNIYMDNVPKNNQKKNNSNKNINFQDKPITSSYIESMAQKPTKNSFDLHSIKENQSINMDKKHQKWDQRPLTGAKPSTQLKYAQQMDQKPIKSMKQEDYQSHYNDSYAKPPIKNAKNYSSNRQIQENRVKENLYRQAEERPITGAAKDFKELMKEKLKSQKYVQIQENQNEYQNQSESQMARAQPKHFLKRGSRQHLSSAITKGKPPKPKNREDQNKNDLDRSRNLTPNNKKNEPRAVSQNRVLGKRLEKERENEKISKKQISKNTEEQDEYSRIKPVKKEKPKQIQTKLTKNVPEKPSPLNNKKKKAKNVFDDSGQSSSSSQQEQFINTRQNRVQQPSHTINQDKSQVIRNVYLTQEQLQQILQRYGKSARVEQTESQKIKTLRNKYSQLCRLAELQKEQNLQKLQRERQQFQKYKAEQMNKIKNQRRVMERQLKNPTSSQHIQKEKEQLQLLKQQIQKERQQYKRKDKTNKIIMDKYKKQNEELKTRVERLQENGQKEVFVAKQKQVLNTKKSGNIKTEEMIPNDEKIDKTLSKYMANNNKNKKEEENSKQQMSYKDISSKDIKKQKINASTKQTKQKPKTKYEYVEQQQNLQKNKSTSFKNESLQNKWLSNKFGAHSSSDDSQHSQEEPVSGKTNLVQWSPAMKLSDLTKIDLSIKMVNEQMINSMFKFENILQYRKYQQIKGLSTRTIVNTTRNAKNCYVANLYSDRSKELIYDNGTKKQSFENGYSIIYFKNGDRKQMLADKTVLYYFHDKQVDQITLSNGVNIFRFEHNQVQFHFDDGEYIEIRHPDGTIKVLPDKYIKR